MSTSSPACRRNAPAESPPIPDPTIATLTSVLLGRCCPLGLLLRGDRGARQLTPGQSRLQTSQGMTCASLASHSPSTTPAPQASSPTARTVALQRRLSYTARKVREEPQMSANDQTE